MTVLQCLAITVARNDSLLLKNLAQSMKNQTKRPEEWIIILDENNDSTIEALSKFLGENKWASIVSKNQLKGAFPRGERISRLFSIAVGKSSLEWDFCSKIDADMELEKNYFEKILSEFKDNPRLGIASGNCILPPEWGGKMERTPEYHTRGGLKTYRRECYDQIGGLEPVDGWDTIDNVRAKICGWETSNFKHITALHARPTGLEKGLLYTSFNEGRKSYFLGYFKPFFLAKILHRMLSRPLFIGGLAMLFGYTLSWVRRTPQINDENIQKHIKKRQISQLSFGFLKGTE